MASRRLRDLIVVLPGITGSVLSKGDEPLWAPTAQAAWNVLANFQAPLDDLRLGEDDPAVDMLADGIRATALMPDVQFVPGLVKIDGYSKTCRAIKDHFKVEVGSLDGEMPANFYEFPYDWRRDNRVAARQLKRLIDRQLPVWRTIEKDAKVILIAHSMGGLVARYYLEVLPGDAWRDCKALITFGTPYRGSLNALDFLANGYKKAFVDLTAVMRSFTSIYQLLPIYKALRTDKGLQRVAEATNVPNVDPQKAAAALAFHREIEAAVNKHREDADYKAKGYKIIPIVGTRQPTLQSADLAEGVVTMSRSLPPGIDKFLEDGDGTVPRASAIPIELSAEYRDTYVPERHGSLQHNDAVLSDLRGRVEQMQVSGLGEIRGPAPKPEAATAPAIALDLDDLYLPRESVTLSARILDADPDHPPGGLEARIKPVYGAGEITVREFDKSDGVWTLRLDDLAPALYRVEVRAIRTETRVPPAVHDLFMIAC